jgi:hypothetical protein
LAELLLTHHDQLKIWAPEDCVTAAIQQAILFWRRNLKGKTAAFIGVAWTVLLGAFWWEVTESKTSSLEQMLQ